MANIDLHHCPRCELRLTSVEELQDHMAVDHELGLRAPGDSSVAVELDPPRPSTSGTVMVPVDPTTTPGAALAVAVAVVRQAGMAVEVVAVPPSELRAISTAEHLRHRARDARALGAPAASSHVLASGDVADAIVAHSVASGASLICMATHSRGPVGELVLGSVSEAVLRRSPVPVLFVGPHAVAPAAGFTRLLVGLDGSDLAEHALDVARATAGRLGASVFLVEVLTGPLPQGIDVYETSYLARTAHGLGDVAGYDVLHGRDAARAIVDWVQEREGTVVVLGTHGRTGLRRLAAGSVALEVVRRAPCPVLLLPSAAAAGASAGAAVTVMEPVAG